MDFKLWLEFEEVDPSNWNLQNDFCNIQVEMLDGRSYGVNVWTYEYLKTAVQLDILKGINCNGSYIIPPDLFVKELTRNCIEKTIQDLLEIGDLEKVLNPSVVSKKN